MLTPPDSDGGDKLEKYLGKDLRRYSDTKLLGSVDVEACDPMLECHSQQQHQQQQQQQQQTYDCPQRLSVAGRKRPLIKQHSESAATASSCHDKNTVLDLHLPYSPLSPAGVHEPTPPQSQMVRRSMHTVDMMMMMEKGPQRQTGASISSGGSGQPAASQQIDKGRQFFKSLPNLSSSCESLIKK